jgi:molecular chaperone GrpE
MSQKNSKKDENKDTEIIDIDYQIEHTEEEITSPSMNLSSSNEKLRDTESSENDSKVKELSEIKQLYGQLEEKDEAYNKLHNRYLRALADYENLHKRTKTEKAQIIKNANQQLLLRLLNIADTLEKAETSISSTENVEVDVVVDSFTAIHKQFCSILRKEGVERIQAVGKKFDPNFHEAVFVKPDPNAEEDTILEEVQTGYLLNSSLLRPTKVIIAKKETNGEK